MNRSFSKLPNIFLFAPRRGVKIKAVVITTALICTLFSGYTALAGQGPSQYCSDGGGMEQHIINSPITFNTEAGGPVGPANNGWIVCFSPTPWGDGSPAPTGGAAWFGSNQGTTSGTTYAGCGSDNNSTALQFGCNNQVSTNLSNPTSPSAGVTYSNSINVPGVAGVNTGCDYGYTAGTGGVGCGGGGGPAQRPSQYCADNYGNEGPRLVHDPITLDFEPGSSSSNPNYLLTCYSTYPYGSSGGVTGGAASVYFPVLAGQGGVGCWSDPGAQVRIDCNETNFNSILSSPTNGVAGYSLSGQITALGTPVPIPGSSVQAGTGCAGGTIAISTSSCANGQYLGISGTGDASGQYGAISGTGCTGGNDPNLGTSISGTNCAWGGLAGISGTGPTGGLIAASTAGCSTGWYAGINAQGCANSTLLAISGTGPATAYGNNYNLAVSGTGCAVGNPNTFAISGSNCAWGGSAGVSGLGNSSGRNLAISGIGTATSNGDGLVPGIAISGANNSTGRDVAISGTGTAAANDDEGAALLNVSEGEVWVGDGVGFLNNGILAVAQTVEHIAYSPDPVATALKEAGLAQMMPDVLYNMATGPLQGGMSVSSNSNLSAVAAGPPPRQFSMPPVMEAQKYRKFCVPAAVRSVLATGFGSVWSQEFLAMSMVTLCWDCKGAWGGTAGKTTLWGLNRDMFQDRVEFIRRMPHNESDLMGMMTYSLVRESHPIALAVDPAILEHNLLTPMGSGGHMVVGVGYNHDSRKLDIYDVYDAFKCTSGRPRCWWPHWKVRKYWGPEGTHRVWPNESLELTYEAVIALEEDIGGTFF